ncbi:MAG: ComEA family DNA-binding protein [Phycisphaerales bacterium]
MSGDADKAWAEMVGGGSGANRPSPAPPPAPSQTPPQPPSKAPAPPLAAAAKWGAVAVLGVVAIIAVVWVILSNRTRPAIVDAPKPQTTSVGADASTPAQPAPSPSSGSLLDLNAATAAQLEHLPGIGPAIAQRIIDDRTKHGRYTSVDDLDRVQGIGKKTIDKLRPFVMVK